jgi:hypothetical protein
VFLDFDPDHIEWCLSGSVFRCDCHISSHAPLILH